MSVTSALRLAIALQFISLVLSIYMDGILEPYLPTLLQEYLTWENEREPSSIEWIAYIASLPFLIIYFVSSVGLLLIKRWAKWPYIVSGVTFLPFYAFLPPTVEHSASSAVGEIEIICFGLILGLLFYTAVLDRKNA